MSNLQARLFTNRSPAGLVVRPARLQLARATATERGQWVGASSQELFCAPAELARGGRLPSTVEVKPLNEQKPGLSRRGVAAAESATEAKKTGLLKSAELSLRCRQCGASRVFPVP